MNEVGISSDPKRKIKRCAATVHLFFLLPLHVGVRGVAFRSAFCCMSQAFYCVPAGCFLERQGG